ncbi:MAG: hypothetical protein GC145_14355 [Caulobacter sp.]|nr:hypothetical protein [Caulobacter sp.]
MADLNLKLILETLDRGASGKVRSYTVVVHGLNREVKTGTRSWLDSKSAIEKNASAMDRATQANRRGSQSLEDVISRQRRLRLETERSEGALTRFFRTMGGGPRGRAGGGGGGGGWLAGAASGVIGGLPGLAATTGAAVAGGATAGTIGFGKSVVDTGARFESYEAGLKTLEGSQAKAREAMSWVQKFAKTTPYDLDQVMQSYVRLRAYGIEPTNGTLLSLGNTASAMQKDLMSAVEMLADAQTGEFERLKEFGVRAKQQGDKVTFTYSQNGKDIEVSSKKTAADIRRTLLGIFDGRFKGAMDEQSRTWNGMMSNMGDSWVGFKRKVADAGLFEKVKGHLAGVLEFLDKAEKDGRLDKWAKEIATSVGQVADSMARVGKAVDWVQLSKDVATVARSVAWLAEQFAKLDRLSKTPIGRIVAGRLNPVTGAQQAWEGLTNPQVRGALGRAGDGLGAAIESTRNPWARPGPPRGSIAPPILGGNRPMPGLGGGPLQKPMKGKLEIDLAPGLVIRQANFGDTADATWRLGRPGDRP